MYILFRKKLEVVYRRGAEGGETGEIPHPRDLGQGQGGEEGRELPHPVLGPKGPKTYKNRIFIEIDYPPLSYLLNGLS